MKVKRFAFWSRILLSFVLLIPHSRILNAEELAPEEIISEEVQDSEAEPVKDNDEEKMPPEEVDEEKGKDSGQAEEELAEEASAGEEIPAEEISSEEVTGIEETVTTLIRILRKWHPHPLPLQNWSYSLFCSMASLGNLKISAKRLKQ